MSSWFEPFPAPPMPEDTPTAEAACELRWEDVAQDGRFAVVALAPTIDRAVWNGLVRDNPGALAAQEHGVIPILSRMTAVGTDEPIRVVEPARARGTYQVAHAVDAAGAVDRLFMNAWVEVRGARGRMYPPQGPGPLVLAGRVFVEHTFTRLFAPPGARRVTRIDLPGVPPVPEARYDAPGWQTALRPPAGATALDAAPAADAALTCFGLDHTDSNQHVNSLIYPRLFVEATLRRLDAAGRGRALSVRALDVAFRKPSFAGDRVRVHLALFELDGRVGATCALVAEGEPLDRPRVAARLLLA